MKSINKVPEEPINQDKLTKMYFLSKDMLKTDNTKVMLPRHANKKNKNEIPSVDLFFMFKNI